MQTDFPYEQYRDSKVWKVLKEALENLVANQDIDITTEPDYVIGYLAEMLSEDYKSGS
ncbi:MAG: hypothetical protein ACYC27_06290 [Armatimonadota bacterium]